MEAYSHIELTPDEIDEAILWAKRKKEDFLKDANLRELEAKNRKFLTGSQWTVKQTESFMEYRATRIFDTPFLLDNSNLFVYKMLCYYFSNDSEFVTMANSLDIKNSSLDKGILLVGSIGVGKTVLMKLFSRNQRQVFAMKTAKSIADMFQTEGEASLQQLLVCPPLPVNDSSNFYHSKMGLCIDDIGTEELKNHYGNRKNVVGDLIELRYANGNVGPLLHLTTNLTGEQLKDFYGDRVASRLRETMNIMEIKGKDRRI